VLFKVFVNAQDTGMGYTLHKVVNDTILGGEVEKLEGRAAVRGALAGRRDRPTEASGSSARELYGLQHIDWTILGNSATWALTD